MIRSKEKSEYIKGAMLGYWDGPGADGYDAWKKRQKERIFIMTREDTVVNLNKVIRQVLKKWKDMGLAITDAYITPVIRKGRRDVYILTDDNELFYHIFYETLKQEQEKLLSVSCEL